MFPNWFSSIVKDKKDSSWISANIRLNTITGEYETSGSTFILKHISINIPVKKDINIIDLRNLPWNKNGSRWKKGDISSIDTIIIHQSAGPGTIESINDYHITGPNHLGSEGAPHICYDFAIRKNGEICKLNNFEDVLWSNSGANIRGVAILVVGNFTATKNGVVIHHGSEEPSPNQINSLKNLVNYLCTESELKNTLSKERVFGHNYFGKEYCPGDILTDICKDIRSCLL